VRIRRAAGARPERRGRASELLLAASVLGLAVGGTLRLAGLPDGASLAWALTTVVGIVPLLGSVVAGLRKRELGVDLIALLAMAGAVLLDEYLAGAVIALMLASGRTLEARASGRASRELRALLQRARASRRAGGGHALSAQDLTRRRATVVLPQSRPARWTTSWPAEPRARCSPPPPGAAWTSPPSSAWSAGWPEPPAWMALTP